MTKEKVPNLSKKNYEIMIEVWNKDEVMVRDVYEAINSKRDVKVSISTIKVQLARLEKYGWLKKRKDGKNIYYSAIHGRKKAVDGLITDLKTRIFNGSNLNLVKYLFQHSKITKEEIESIKNLISNFEEDQS
jgi:predicted transcriptional regulator